MPLLILIALFAIADFAVLFTLGAKIGLLASLLWIVASGALGIHLIRRESLLTIQRARARMAAGEIPSDEILAGASFVLAGILLIAPGFLSDIVGLICLIPGSGQLMRRWSTRGGRGAGPKGTEIPGDWNVHRRDSESSASDGQAGDDADPIEGEYLGKER
ncbi:FxsA family protein [Salinicola acroporae]|uniref:Exlusion protein FxsA n=1 Tax=Salinicola acroporae TaxID=1541440 RepID=A0ABT6I7A6_9GAMM|nr:FxsA family protein [Salinicola acroporae]MDH4573534.1 exlusion protein FxsA [Salinicola acroporae]